MRYYLLLTLFICQQALCQTFAEHELKTSINEVTIYLQGALVSRNGKMEIPQGKSILRIKSLSPHIDEKSIQVKGTGPFTILSVNHKLNYLQELKRDERIEKLNDKIESINYEVATHESRLEVLSETQSLLNENKKLGGESSGASLVQIRQAIEFYDRALTSIKSEEIEIRHQIRELNQQKKRIEQEITHVRQQKELPTSEIEVRIESPQRTTGGFSMTYVVSHAGWYPKYDIRVNSVEEPLELKYKADVYQNTGVDWDNVKIRLSNGNPNQSGLVPQLQTWYLNYARNTIFNRSAYNVMSGGVRNVSGTVLDDEGEPLAGATVLVKGSTIGTVTDLNGNYSLTLPNGANQLHVSFIGYVPQNLPITSSNLSVRMEPDLQSLEEVVVVGYGTNSRAASVGSRRTNVEKPKAITIPTTTVENQTTVEFEVNDPYTIKSNGKKLSVDLSSHQIETIYEYYAVPKLDKDAFLVAQIIDWDQYHLLEGEVNLYFEDAYVGRSILDARSLEDTLTISLGRDKSIVIGRTKIDEYTKQKTLAINKVESRGYKIIARNNKSQTIRLTLFDQIPVAAISDISVTPNELSNGVLDEKTGEVTWELELKPKEQIEMEMEYEVKYPKNEKIVLK